MKYNSFINKIIIFFLNSLMQKLTSNIEYVFKFKKYQTETLYN